MVMVMVIAGADARGRSEDGGLTSARRSLSWSESRAECIAGRCGLGFLVDSLACVCV